MITKGTPVPYQVGLLTVCADVLGLVRDGEQYMLRIEYVGHNADTGRNELIIREFQRDRKTIEGLYRDAGGII